MTWTDPKKPVITGFLREAWARYHANPNDPLFVKPEIVRDLKLLMTGQPVDPRWKPVPSPLPAGSVS